jgi:hypothetical protein
MRYRPQITLGDRLARWFATIIPSSSLIVTECHKAIGFSSPELESIQDASS